MALPMRHLLAGSAVAGLLFLLPAGGANAQDNRNTGSWGGAGGVLIFVAGGAVGWWLSKRASKGRQNGGNKDAALARFDRLDSGVQAVDTKLENVLNGFNKLTSSMESQVNPGSVNALDEKLTKLEATSEKGFRELSRILESKMNLGSKAVNISLETVEQHIVKVEEMVKMTIGKKEGNQINQYISSSDKSTIESCNNRLQPIIVDTSAIINGSIIGILEADLPFEELKGRIIVHECIRHELKGLRRDKSIDKRKKGEAGCDNLLDLCAKFSDRIDNNSTRYDLEKVDEKLLQLTSDTNGMLVTRDVELAKKCHSKNLQVLNLDNLYRAVRKKALVGSEVKVYLKKQSEKDSKKHPQDAIAYIDDFRVVVKNANEYIGHEKTIVITNLSEGGTYFAELSSGKPPTLPAANPPNPPPAP